MRTIKAVALFVAGLMLGSCFARPVVIQESAAAVAQPPAPRAVSPYGEVQDAMVKVNIGEGHCTGVLLSRQPAATESRYIATATHCFIDDDKNHRSLTGINGMPMKGEVIANDGNDHVLVKLSQPVQGNPVWFGEFPPPGSAVFTWGNPGSLEDQLRIGYVQGLWMHTDQGEHRLYHVIGGMDNWHGDSGGPIFDLQGRVIALHYGYYYETNYSSGTQVRFTIAEPFAFTQEQLGGIP